MSALGFAKRELVKAVARGVRQCVVIGPRQTFDIRAGEHAGDGDAHAGDGLQMFALSEELLPPSPATLVQTEFASEPLAAALEKSEFDKLKTSLFVWLGGAGYRSMDAAIASLAFMASLPRGSGVVLDYVVERTSVGSFTQTALDALASRISEAGGGIRYLIQPQAVAAMLHGLGFTQVVDVVQEEVPLMGSHLVSAVL
jgi:O-methyltransferase involved in polyketide biosynthesis